MLRWFWGIQCVLLLLLAGCSQAKHPAFILGQTDSSGGADGAGGDGSGDGRPLISGVGVGPTKSLALGKTATQSSTAFSRPASLAVDGNTSGNYADGSVTHTNSELAWWKVDLGSSMPIGTVNIWNRTDCCSDRLKNFDVQLSDDNVNWEPTINVRGQAGSPTTVNFNGVNGRYVRIKLKSANYLSIAEVEVFAN